MLGVDFVFDPPGGCARAHLPDVAPEPVSELETRLRVLNFIVVVAVLDCSVGVVVVVVDIVGGVDDVGDVINADEAGGAGISAVVMDATI
jgi:hypothetical protein